MKKTYFCLSIIAILMLFNIAAGQAPPGSTECNGENSNPACQKPLYADNNSKYLYDLDASWILSGRNAPGGNGPSAFHAGSAGGIESQTSDQEILGNYEEYYIENSGEAGTSSWGRGTKKENTLSGGKIENNEYGEFLVNSPYEGQCGDGINQEGSSCPQDGGLPDQVISEYSPSHTITYDEGGSKSKTLPDEASGSDVTISGSSGGGPDYDETSSYIKKKTIQNLGAKKIGDVTHKYRSPTDPGVLGKITGTSAVQEYNGSNAIAPVEYCTEKSESDTYYSSKPGFSDKELTLTENVYKYDAPSSLTSSEARVKLIYNNEVVSGEKATLCTGTETILTDCSNDENINCSTSSTTVYSYTDTSLYVVFEKTIDAYYTDYDIESTNVWGPVNSELDFSGNVVNSPGGYHAYTDDSNSGENSNQGSTSYNTYTLIESNGNFVADRITKRVSDADGPDGRADALLAYNDQTDQIKGNTSGFLSATPGFVSPNLNFDCPGNDVRCVGRIDFKTKDDGWTSLGNSYTVEKETVPVTASAGACETYRRLSGVSRSQFDCSPGPNYDVCGDKPGEKRVSVRGPDVNTSTLENYKAHNLDCMNTATQAGYCVKPDGTNGAKLVPEGTVANIAPKYERDQKQYQKEGNSQDQSICLDRESTTAAGEWYNIDDFRATKYVREEIDQNGGDKTGALGSDEWINYWLENPDTGADPAAVPNRLQGGGFNLEDDCYGGPENCANNLQNQPVRSEFSFRAKDDDYATEHNYDVNLSHISVRVRTDYSWSSGSKNSQDDETSLNLGPLENSQINTDDDQWALAPNTTFGLNNFGELRLPGQCHGLERLQGVDRDKTNRDYANSYLARENITVDGETVTVSTWINPDNSNQSLVEGGTSCDLTGKDWGIAYDNNTTTLENNPEPEPINVLKETGGESGQIQEIKTPPPDDFEEYSLTLIPGSRTTCIGNRCEDNPGSLGSDFDSDNYVNETGDGMTGALQINSFTHNGDVCIGSRCVNDPNQAIDPSGKTLDSDNNEASGGFILQVQNITNYGTSNGINFESDQSVDSIKISR